MKIKKLVSTVLVLSALFLCLTFTAGAETYSYVDTSEHYTQLNSVDYMQLILDSIAVRDFESAEKYTNLRNEKIILLGLEDTYSTFKWDDAFCLMSVSYKEAGCGKYVSDNDILAQCNTVQNRVSDPRFPNSIREVLEQKGQYGSFHYRGVYLINRGDSALEKEAFLRSFGIAIRSLHGEKAVNYNGEECISIYASRTALGKTWWKSEAGTYYCY